MSFTLIEMPFALAFAASTLIHAAALLGSGWILPGSDESEPPPIIEAVLLKPAIAAQPVPSAPRRAPDKPRQKPVVAPVALAVAPAADLAASETPAPVADAPSAAVDADSGIDGIGTGIPVTHSETMPDNRPGPAAGTSDGMAAPTSTPASIALPDKGRVRYTVIRGEAGFVVGQSVHTWEHDGFSYQLQSVTETTGLAAFFRPARVVHSSQGEITAAGLRPREFRNERASGVDTANFDWTRRVVAYGGREQGVAAGTQDMLSMYYQLVLLMPNSGAVDMPIATGRKLENYRFDILGEEAVILPAGEQRAIHLKTRSGNDTIELWLAVGAGADRRGLPLKIRFTDRKGEIFDQLAEDINAQDTQ